MYLEYYSLERPPFRITPDPSLFFTGGANGRGVVLEALLYAVKSGEGILKVVGEVGSGKTMLCRMLEDRLPESVEIVYLANPNLSPHDILYAIAFELKLATDHSTQRLVLMQQLQEYLLKQHSLNRTVLVIVEEAQSMPLETLEEIRLFSNLETHQHKLMQIVLFGQPELDKNLEQKSIRQLRERITHSFYLGPLGADETSDYIRFRLQAAGSPCPQVFSTAAEKLIAKASGGLTRRINILADKSLLAAYAESATAQRPRSIDNQLQPTVLPRHVRAAINDSGYPSGNFLTWPRLATAGGVLVVLGAVLIWVFGQSQADEVGLMSNPSAQAIAAEGAARSEPSLASDRQSVEPAAPVFAPIDEQPQQSIAAIVPTAKEIEAAISVSVPELAVEADNSGPEVETLPIAANTLAAIETTPENVVFDGLVTTAPEIFPAPIAEAEVNAADAADLPAVALAPSADLIEEPSRTMVAAVSQPDLLDSVNRGQLPQLMRARSEAMVSWYETADQRSYIVQLLSVDVSESRYITQVLQGLEQDGFIDSTYVCLARSESQDSLFWKVFSASFASVALAREYIEKLPSTIRANGPFVQNLSRLNCNLALSVNQ